MVATHVGGMQTVVLPVISDPREFLQFLTYLPDALGLVNGA